jgi:hypothetical protein
VWRAIVIYLAVCFAGVLLLIANAFAAPTLEEVVTSPKTFAVCKAVDIASTAYLLEHGLAIEANPVVAWSLKIGGYAPLVFASIGIYWLMEKYKEAEGVRTGIAIANGVTCGVAVSNLLLVP